MVPAWSSRCAPSLGYRAPDRLPFPPPGGAARVPPRSSRAPAKLPLHGTGHAGMAHTARVCARRAPLPPAATQNLRGCDARTTESSPMGDGHPPRRTTSAAEVVDAPRATSVRAPRARRPAPRRGIARGFVTRRSRRRTTAVSCVPVNPRLTSTGGRSYRHVACSLGAHLFAVRTAHLPARAAAHPATPHRGAGRAGARPSFSLEVIDEV